MHVLKYETAHTDVDVPGMFFAGTQHAHICSIRHAYGSLLNLAGIGHVPSATGCVLANCISLQAGKPV